MDKYNVTGMSCAACQARVEKAVNGVDGVTSVSVSLLTNSMQVEGTASSASIIKAVKAAGYGASVQNGESKSQYYSKLSADEDALKDKTTPVLRNRLIASVVVLVVLMYFSMGHMMWGWPVPDFFEGNHIALGMLEMILAGIIMVINQRFFISGGKALIHLGPNMDSLIAIGSGVSFIYSAVSLFIMTSASLAGDIGKVENIHHNLYFETAAMILTLITVGKTLESYSKGKTTNALKSLMELSPKVATVIRDGEEVVVPIEQVVIGDVFAVKPGENIPVDGFILEGSTSVNEAALTGESMPVDKVSGDTVKSATTNLNGYIKCKATRVGEDTTLAQIIQMVSDSSATKAPVAKLADTISGYFVPVVIGISLVTFVIWMLIGRGVGFSLARAISVLVVSCPCALGLATPVAIMVGNGVGAKNGILFKSAEALQEAGKAKIVALDKTGTITSGEPVVTDVISLSDDLLPIAYALEVKSEHPLAKAIVKYCADKEVKSGSVDGFEVLSGSGVSGMFNGAKVIGGNYKYITGNCGSNKAVDEAYIRLSSEGKTPMVFARDSKIIGLIAVADSIKPDSAEAISELKVMGIKVVMLTGDNPNTAEAIGKISGVDEVIAGVLPDGKDQVIKKLKEYGKTIMVGDGINDAVALTSADIGIAIGAGSDVAIDAADIVLMKNSLMDVSAAIRLSRKTYRNIAENLFWALIYNTILIPVAAGLFVWAGITMNPMLGALAMSISSFCVVSNSLRLNLLKVHDSSRDKKIKNPVTIDSNSFIAEENNNKCLEDITMAKTVKIEGMMCGHCEATVKKALEAIEGIDSAVVSKDSGTAVLTLSSDVSDELIKKTVEDKDFKVTGIE